MQYIIADACILSSPTLSITSNPANRPTSPEVPTETAQAHSKLHIRSDTDREILRSETTEVIMDSSHPRTSISKELRHTEKDGRSPTDGQKLPKEPDKPSAFPMLPPLSHGTEVNFRIYCDC